MKNFPVLLVLVLFLHGCALSKSAPPTYSVLFLGDTHFGENYEPDTEDPYSMAAFEDFLAMGDYTIANLETPLTLLPESPFEDEKDYVHWSDPETATSTFENYGFDAFSLGNNHSMDYGWEGLLDTFAALEAKDFNWFGSGADQTEALTPLAEELLVPGSSTPTSLIVFGGFEHRSSYEKYDFYADDERTDSPGGVNSINEEETLEAIRTYRSEDPEAFIVLFPHWGDNYEMATAGQEKWAKSFVDAGADLVIGQGAHLFQEVELYEGKWIVYGLGNFVFQSPGRYEKSEADPYSVAASLSFSTDGVVLRLYPIFSDNLVTEYHSRFVTEEEWEELREREDLEDLDWDEDTFGFFFELSI